MKPKSISKKLVLNKVKVTNLDHSMLLGVKGGISSPSICDSCIGCGGSTDCATGPTCVTCHTCDTCQYRCTLSPTCFC